MVKFKKVRLNLKGIKFQSGGNDMSINAQCRFTCCSTPGARDENMSASVPLNHEC
jgi:hypothetical protein